jgi:myo-inositol-1(or 4)-monophosphatase
MTPELEFAIEKVRQAGALIMDYFRRPIEINHKAGNDPVTEADLAVDRFLRESFRQEFPQDGWLSEESPVAVERLSCPRIWIVDPIDGTREFIKGIEQFSVSVALVSCGRPCAAVVYNPATRELFSAERGGGAFLNGDPMRVSTQPDLQQCRMVAGRHEPDLVRSFAFGTATPVGSIAYKMAMVASGAADVVLSLGPKGEWDVCAGDLLIREAGGHSTNRMGEELIFGNQVPRIQGIVAANPGLHSAALAWLTAYHLQKS